MVSNGGFDFCISVVVLPPQMSVPGCECGILELLRYNLSKYP